MANLSALRGEKRPSLLEQLSSDPEASAIRIQENLKKLKGENDIFLAKWKTAQGVRPSPIRYGSRRTTT